MGRVRTALPLGVNIALLTGYWMDVDPAPAMW